jgi:hypothetical protein
VRACCLDALFGGSLKSKLKTPVRARMFATTTANVMLETGLGLKHRETAGIVFQSLGTPDFEGIPAETEELLAGTAAETGSKMTSKEDEFDYRRLMLRDPDFDDLVVALNTVSSQLQAAATVTACSPACSPSRRRAAPFTSSTTSSAAASTRSSRPPATRPGTTSASCV